MLEVLATGPLSTIQDKGRFGYQEQGVPRSGALDELALDRANRVVGNADGTAGLELSYGRFRARFLTDATIASSGATAPLRVAGEPREMDAAQRVSAGQEVEVGGPVHGVHTYLAVRGGIEVPPVLGSRSTDTLSGLGPAPLRRGIRLAIGGFSGAETVSGVGGVSQVDGVLELPGNEIEVRVRFGPRDDWLADAEELLRNPYRISTSNRIGARLAGPALQRAVPGELASEGLVAGAIQVPGNGLPIVFLSDHPSTGGYPVMAVVHPDDLRFVAQARPGTTVLFRGP